MKNIQDLIVENANLTYAFANKVSEKALGHVIQDSQVWKDALSAANTAIVKAAQGYEESLGKFAPRFWRIATQELGVELRQLATPVTASQTYLQVAAKLKDGEAVEANEEKGAVELSKLESFSINATMKDDDDGEATEVGEILEVEQETPYDKANANDRRNVLAMLVRKLNKRDRMIVLRSKPFGESTLDELGAKLNLTRARICQLRSLAIERLQMLATEIL